MHVFPNSKHVWAQHMNQDLKQICAPIASDGPSQDWQSASTTPNVERLLNAQTFQKLSSSVGLFDDLQDIPKQAQVGQGLKGLV